MISNSLQDLRGARVAGVPHLQLRGLREALHGGREDQSAHRVAGHARC